jgi:aryl-alcohol dehydrogenase-like predicted oxidoreductase
MLHGMRLVKFFLVPVDARLKKDNDMEKVELGSSGIQVSRLCLGTWNMCGEEGWGPVDDQASIDLIHYAMDHGCNCIDTARGYGNGYSERIVGKAIKGRREDVIVATKMFHCPADQVGGYIDQSLECMQTDYIDLYLCHWPFPSLPLEPFFDSMIAEKEKGRIRAIGASNFDARQMAIAKQYGVCSLQPPLSILWRIPDETMDFCRDHQVAMTPYSPLAQGLLTGRYSRGTSDITGVRLNNQLFSDQIYPKALGVARTVDQIADKLDRLSSQVALAWLLQTPGIASLIVGASNIEQWRQNLGSLDLVLADSDYELLDREGREVWDLLGSKETMWGWKPT